MVNLVRIDASLINPRMVMSVFPRGDACDGTRIVMQDGTSIFSSLSVEQVAKICDPPPAPFPDDDFPF